MMVFCSNCGKENPEDARFCDGCGYQIANVSAQEGAVQGQTSNQSYVRSDYSQQYPSYGQPPSGYPQVPRQENSEVDGKKSWWQGHIGESRIYYCRKNGCGWSGTKTEMKHEDAWYSAPPRPIEFATQTLWVESYKEVDYYSCPRCGTLIKSRIRVKPVSEMGKPDHSIREVLFVIAVLVITMSLMAIFMLM